MAPLAVLECICLCINTLATQVDPVADEEMMREVLQDYMQKAHAYKADLGDKRLTVEHVMLAMAEVRK